MHWLLPRLKSFRERHPYYRLRLQTSLEIQDVRHGLADISIRMGQGHWPELAQKALFSDELLVVASPHFNGGKLPRSAEEIVSCPLIRSSDAPWTDWCRAANVREPANVEGLSANDSNIVLGAVFLGQGIALERRTLVADAIARGELVQITDIRVPYPYPYWLVWQQREVLSVKQTHFMEWIGAEVTRYLDRTG